MCDRFVYIPQYAGATASLNVHVSCAIIMSAFAHFAGFAEQAREGEKFVVDMENRSGKSAFENPDAELAREIAEKRAQRAAKKMKTSDAVSDKG